MDGGVGPSGAVKNKTAVAGEGHSPAMHGGRVALSGVAWTIFRASLGRRGATFAGGTDGPARSDGGREADDTATLRQLGAEGGGGKDVARRAKARLLLRPPPRSRKWCRRGGFTAQKAKRRETEHGLVVNPPGSLSHCFSFLSTPRKHAGPSKIGLCQRLIAGPLHRFGGLLVCAVVCVCALFTSRYRFASSASGKRVLRDSLRETAARLLRAREKKYLLSRFRVSREWGGGEMGAATHGQQGMQNVLPV